MKPTVCDLDVSTGETIIREMTDEEYAQWLIDIEPVAQKEASE